MRHASKLAALTLLGSFALAPTAHADDPVRATIAVEGRGSAAIGRAIEAAASDSMTLVPATDGTSVPDASQAAILAETLDVDVVIHGRVTRRGRRLALEAFARDGALIGESTTALPRGRRGARRAEAAAEGLVAIALEDARRRAEQEAIAQSVVQPAPEPEPAPAAYVPPPREEPAPEPEPEPEGVQPILLDAQAGFGLRSRSAEALHGDGGTGVHDTGLFPEVTLRLATAPFRGALAPAWASVDLALGVGMSTHDRGGNELSTSTFRVVGNLGYGFDLGPLRISPVVGFGVDSVSLTTNRILPSSSYTFLRAGVNVAVPIVDALGVFVDAGIRPVLGVGDLGDLSVLGLDAAAGVAGVLGDRFTYRIGGGITSYSGDAHAHTHEAGGHSEEEEAAEAAALTSIDDLSLSVFASGGIRL